MKNSGSRLPWVVLAVLILAGGDTEARQIDDSATDNAPSEITTDGSSPAEENVERWQFFAPVEVPNAGFQLCDLILTPEIFEHARTDLADLRLLDAQGQPVPYRLRIRNPESIREPLSAVPFNRSEPLTGPQELTLELRVNEGNSSATLSHNEISISTTGEDFRRPFTVSSSDDGRNWKQLVSGTLVRFRDGETRYQRESVGYPESRQRMVRIVVQPDATIEDQFKISAATVMRHIELPGERVSTEVAVGNREPGRVNGSPGSTWILDTGGRNVPGSRLEVEVTDAEFVRDIQLEYDVPARFGPSTTFLPAYVNENQQTWQRRSGERMQPMLIDFYEVQTSRFRLRVTDHSNKPLTIRSARISAAARQLVFAVPVATRLPLKLYFGNPAAESPNYDFARNLSDGDSELTGRASLMARQTNVAFTAPPMPVTERHPWLIYVVLGVVSAMLGGVIVSLSRAAIAIHDLQS